MRRKKRKMDGSAPAKAFDETRTNVTDFGTRRPRENAVDAPERPAEKKLSRWQRFLINLHLKTMADEPTKPYWNPQMIGTWCSVIGLIVILVSLIAAGAFALGMMWEKNSTIERELREVKKTAQDAKDLNLANRPGEEDEEEQK